MKKSSYMQYRITVNGSQGEITDHIDNQRWEKICDVCEDRGLYAKLERRLITDKTILQMIEDKTGYMELDENTVICPWDILAEADFMGS